MNLLRRLMGPSNSVILAYDHIDAAGEEELERQLDEVGGFYEFAKLSEIVTRLRAGRSQGLASVVFTHARKSLFLRVLPMLRARKIPVTVFLDADSIGLNRLPADEELELYRRQYPEKLSESAYREMRELAWRDPAAANQKLQEYRRSVGPLPLDAVDPTRFFVTWGKLLEVPPDLFEGGLALTSTPEDRERLADSLNFIRHQLGTAVSLAFHPRAPEGMEELLRAGIDGILTLREGAVEKKTPPTDLPRWNFSASDE